MGGRPYTTTNKDGTFELTRVPVGVEMHVYAQTKDFRHVLANEFKLEEGQAEFPAPQVLQRGEAADVLVTDEEGNPVTDMSLKIKPVVGRSWISRAERDGRTDAEGRLKIDGVLPGMEYLLHDARARLSESGFHREIQLIPKESAQDASDPEPTRTPSTSLPTVTIPPAKHVAPEPWALSRDARTQYILEHRSSGPLLNPFVPRIYRTIRDVPRDHEVWGGVDAGGSVDLRLTVASHMTGPVTVGFFSDPTWSAPPVQIREISEPGTHRLDRLPPGRYFIGATVIKNEPRAVALGVHRGWPRPVEIREGPVTDVVLHVTPKLVHGSMEPHASLVYHAFVGQWRDLNRRNLLEGTVTDFAGAVVPFASVFIRRYEREDDKLRVRTP